jgi:hypothetical protein
MSESIEQGSGFPVRVARRNGHQFAVWNKAGYPPRKYFDSNAEALDVAIALADSNPGQTFHVVRFSLKARKPLGPASMPPNPNSKASKRRAAHAALVPA